MRADAGVVISASHNPFYDNGIKIFGRDGFKLPDEDEALLEKHVAEDSFAAGGERRARLGKAHRIEEAWARYVVFLKSALPADLDLSGLKIVVDCAHGAAYRVAPAVFEELGAEVIPIAVKPDGININAGFGALHPERMIEAIRVYGADMGIALDGDADRVIICDEKGQVVDGDQIMALVALDWAKRGMLKGGGVVATVMSNLGLERLLNSHDLSLERTKVGDRYVMERMREGGFNLGGEQSGHIILHDHATTGDGLMSALQVLAVLVESGKPMSELARQFETVPQKLENVRYTSGKPLETAGVKAAIADAEARLAGVGRLLVRPSGTEKLIRVMAEGDDAKLVKSVVADVAAAVKAAG
jgi:phosphoglucosamine mutase